MRIGIDIDSQFIPMTGIQHSVDGLLDGLFQIETPHEITAFASYLAPGAIGEAARLRPETFHWRGLPRAKVDSASLPHFLPAKFRQDHVWFSAEVRARQERVMSCVDPRRSPRARAAHYQVLHVTEPGKAEMGYRNWVGPRQVATIYDLSTIYFAAAFPQHHVEGWGRYFDYAKNHCARVIAISNSTKANIVDTLKISSDRIDVTPLAPRASTKAMPDGEARRNLLSAWGVETQETPFVLYAGTLEPRKNVDRLVRAFADVVRQNPELPHRLVLAGGKWNDLDRDLQSLADDLKIRDRLIVTGYVTNEQMNALMSACAAFVYISLYEGFGMPPLEAMVCGAPVIVSNASSLPEVVGDAGVLVDPGSVEEASAALHMLLTNDEENRRRRALSLAHAGQFSWRRTAELTIQAYEAAAS